MHDKTQADIWYHDTLCSLGNIYTNLHLAIAMLNDKETSPVEVIAVLEKAQRQYPMIKNNLYLEYLDKKKLEAEV